ncbi:MAG: GH3 auxin-responsive promoter family protein [Proteobacteria bacterium]|nr:GH3 auxin-responsive promoter family protein [Pseudomonadota bacterium]
MLQSNADTVFGKRYGFSEIKTIREYQEKIPISDYEGHKVWIDQLASGINNLLTKEQVIMFEPSSGSTSAAKLIPYTGSLKAEYQKGLKVWIYDLATRIPGLFRGKSYWSISPVVKQNQRTPGGTPIGFEEDGEYLGKIQKVIYDSLLAVPVEVKYINSRESFRYVSLLFLLKTKNLSFISVWNPTFFELLVDQLLIDQERLLHDLEYGHISIDLDVVPENYMSILQAKLGRNIKRAVELREILAKTPGEINYAAIWPNLKGISCWASANAKPYAERLAQKFPKARLQGKGLLATEGIVTIPLSGKTGNALAFCSHFYEFIPVNTSSQEVKTASQLTSGETYSVMITTGGGLYRYRLFDLVKVKGFEGSCPLLEFVGKEDKISDYFGEKLNEQFVAEVLQETFQSINAEFPFFMLAPETATDGEFFYTLFLEAGETFPTTGLSRLGVQVEHRLKKNYHYNYCRDLGQIKALRIFRIEGQNGEQSYLKACEQSGQRLGDIKPVVLHPKTGWSSVFTGKYI